MNFVKHERFFGRDITNIIRVSRPPSVDVKRLNQQKRNSSYDISRKVNSKSVPKTSVDQYIHDIYDHIIKKEANEATKSKKMPSDSHNTKQNRYQALQWLFNTHHKYQLFQQTLFMAVWIFDTCYKQSQFMKKIENSVSGLSIAALYMASKYEETYRVPKLRDLLALRGSFSNQKQIIKIEGFITQILDFNFIFESSFKYLQMLAYQTGMSDKNFCLAQYILQLSLLQPKLFEQKQSLLGCGVFYLVNRVRKVPQPWPSKAIQLTNYKEKDLQKVASAYFTIFQNSHSLSGASTLKRKFLTKAYHEVANLRIERRKSTN